MKKEDYMKKIGEIEKAIHDTDDGKITEILAELSDDYKVMLASADDLKTQNEKLKNDNTNLRDTNQRLFLRVGHNPTEEKSEQDSKEELEFENLFDENGELK